MDIIQRNNTNGQFTGGWSGYKTCVRCNNEFLARSGIAKICDGCKKCHMAYDKGLSSIKEIYG